MDFGHMVLDLNQNEFRGVDATSDYVTRIPLEYSKVGAFGHNDDYVLDFDLSMMTGEINEDRVKVHITGFPGQLLVTYVPREEALRQDRADWMDVLLSSTADMSDIQQAQIEIWDIDEKLKEIADAQAAQDAR